MTLIKTRSENWNFGGSKWKLSRSKLDMFLSCPRCFYLDNKLGIKRPDTPPFLINSAVDAQLKREFDFHRANGSKHALQEEYGIDAIPAKHEKIDEWRENFVGVQFVDKKTGMTIAGAIDDLWINSEGEYIVVDYKATAKDKPITELDPESSFHDSYKKQMEVYQWLLRKNGLKVSNIGYFVYCTGKRDQKSFDGVIEFNIKLIPYKGDDSWVERAITDAHKCLNNDQIPPCTPTCDYCAYTTATNEAIK